MFVNLCGWNKKTCLNKKKYKLKTKKQVTRYLQLACQSLAEDEAF